MSEAAAPARGREQKDCGGCMTAALGSVARFRGLFPRVVIRRRGMKKADFQGISMISENTKSIHRPQPRPPLITLNCQKMAESNRKCSRLGE